jgi:hypothetical protein
MQFIELDGLDRLFEPFQLQPVEIFCTSACLFEHSFHRSWVNLTDVGCRFN